jgi:hypothetical protein
MAPCPESYCVSPPDLSPSAQPEARRLRKRPSPSSSCCRAAGYVAAWENRSLILLRHQDHKYLVQCSVLVDVMRSPRVVTSCYELR